MLHVHALFTRMHAFSRMLEHADTGRENACMCVSTLQVFAPPARKALRYLQRVRDYFVCGALLLPISICAVCSCSHAVQSRIILQPSPFFFDETPRGTLRSVCSMTVMLLVFLGFIGYQALALLGMSPGIHPLSIFGCS